MASLVAKKWVELQDVPTKKLLSMIKTVSPTTDTSNMSRPFAFYFLVEHAVGSQAMAEWERLSLEVQRRLLYEAAKGER
jgi:hypothetical protein